MSHSTPGPTPFDIDDIWERAAARVQVQSDGCWRWTGYVREDGYGQFVWQPDTYLAHRIAYQALVGDIPAGMELDHTCRNRTCVNPEHLDPVTRLENVRRSLPYRRRRTHCHQGHEFTPENTQVNKNGVRRCRTCKKNWRNAA